MRDYHVYRRSAIRYWERRRIIYNLALVPPSLLTYMFGAAFASVGDDGFSHPYYVLFLFAVSAFGANVCYTFAYALEFLIGNDEPTSRWLRFGRTTAFVLGVIFAMLLAAIGGADIASMEYHYKL